MHEGGSPTHIVKRRRGNRPEYFSREKMHKSIVAACLSCGVPVGHSESTARRITDSVVVWLEDKPEVTSDDLRRTAARFLKIHHPDAAYLYEHHRSTL